MRTGSKSGGNGKCSLIYLTICPKSRSTDQTSTQTSNDMVKVNTSQKWPLLFVVVTILTLYRWYFAIGLVPILFQAWRSQGYKIRYTIIDASIILVLVFETISIFFSDYRLNTLVESSKIGIGFLVYLCAKHFLKDKSTELIFILTLVILLASLLSVFGFLNTRNWLLSAGFKDIHQFKNLFHPLGQFSNEYVTVELGFVCLLLLFFSRLVRMDQNIPLKISILIGLTLATLTVLLSFSRGAYLALLTLVGWITLLFVTVPQARKPLSFIFTAMLLAGLLATPVFDRIANSISIRGTVSQARSTDGRLNIWAEAIKIGKTKPLMGIGSGNFALRYHSSRRCDSAASFTSRIANTPLQIFVEKGGIGVLIYLCCTVCLFFVLRNFSRYEVQDRSTLLLALGAVFCLYTRDLTFASLLTYLPATIIFLFIVAAMAAIISKYELHVWTGTDAAKLFVFAAGGCTLYLLFNVVLLERRTAQQSALLDFVHQNGFTPTASKIARRNVLSQIDGQYFAEMGLINERVNNKAIEFSLLPKLEKYPIDTTWLKTSIAYYDTALSLVGADGLYCQNLAWLYLLKKNFELAGAYFSRSVAIDCNNPEAFIGLGLLYEIRSDTLQALKYYEKAILTNPDLAASPFYEELKHRLPEHSKIILQNCAKELYTVSLGNPDPIELGRLGAICYYLGCYNDSEIILRKATQALPNLNRPWYYLALLRQTKRNNDADVLAYFQKAALLDPRDYLVNAEIGKLYQKLEKKHLAITHYKRAMKNYIQYKDRHFSKSLDMYNAHPFNDETIPFGLNDYIRPYLDIYELSGTISKLSLSVGNLNDHELFKRISDKKVKPTLPDVRNWNLL